MNILEFSSLVFLGSLLAGFLGAATGLGGGVVIVPLLALGFGVDIRYAMGASLVSVIATSSAAASAYVKEGFSNLRVGMFLEIATTTGQVQAQIQLLIPFNTIVHFCRRIDRFRVITAWIFTIPCCILNYSLDKRFSVLKF